MSLLLKEDISSSNYSKLADDDNANNTWVDKLPTPILYEISEELSSIIDEGSKDNSLKFSWSIIKDHLRSCHLYYLKFRVSAPPKRRIEGVKITV